LSNNITTLRIQCSNHVIASVNTVYDISRGIGTMLVTIWMS